MLYSNINPERSYWMGADGFTWWVGQVQGDGAKKLNKDLSVSNGPVDETRSNRVKVRIIGYHSSKWDELPVEDLPWAQVMVPATSPQSSGFATSHQLSLGSYVIGFFLDGLNCQQPIVMGVIGDIANGDLKKLKPGSLITDNPEQPGFNNVLEPRADNTSQTTGSLGWAAPSNISSPSKDNSGKITFNYNSDITSFLNDKSKSLGTGTTIYNIGGPSYRDLEFFEKHNKQVSLASPCGTETQIKIQQTLGDLFGFLKSIRKLNNQYVNKYTGEVVDFVSKINGFIGRVSNIVADILGSIKTLIIDKIKSLVRNLINSILNPVAESLIPAREFSDQLLNLLICLLDNILKSILQFLENLILGLIENVINAAFCLVQSFINSLLSAITSAINGALQAIQGIVSIISQGGDLIANIASQLADFLASLCSGFGCEIDASAYDMKTGNLQPKSLFGGADAIINTDFLNNIESPKIFDENGKLVRGSLNCSEDNLSILPCPPKILLLGLNGDAGVPSIIPVVDNLGRIISTVIKDSGFNISSSVTSAIATSCNGYGNGARLKPKIGDTAGTGSSNVNLPTLTLDLSSISILSGDSSTLSWTSTGATSVVFSNFGAGTTNGSKKVSPVGTTIYEIEVSGPGGTAKQNIILNVSPIGTGQSTTGVGIVPPSLRVNLNTNSITQGNSATLSWVSTGATAVSFSNFGAGDTNGSLVVNPLSTTIYEIAVSNQSGITTQSVILNVSPVGAGRTNSLVDIVILNPGAGYSPFDKNPNNVNENVVIPANSPNYIGVLTGFTVTNVGSGYDNNTKITVNGTPFGVPNIFDGSITSVTPVVPTFGTGGTAGTGIGGGLPSGGGAGGGAGTNIGIGTANTTGIIVNSYPDIQILGTGSGANIVPIIKYLPKSQSQDVVNRYNIPIEKIDCPGDVVDARL